MNTHETVSTVQKYKGKGKGKAATKAKGERRPYRARAPRKPQADTGIVEGNGAPSCSAGEVASGGVAEADRSGTATAGVTSVREDRWSGRRKPVDPQADPNEESSDDIPADGYSLIPGKQANFIREFFAELIGVEPTEIRLHQAVKICDAARAVIRGLRRERDSSIARLSTLRKGRQPRGTGKARD